MKAFRKITLGLAVRVISFTSPEINYCKLSNYANSHRGHQQSLRMKMLEHTLYNSLLKHTKIMSINSMK